MTAPSTPDGYVTPVLQAQDGSFIGVGGGGMVAFDQAGNVRWSVPNDEPQIATSDGGVIGKSGIVYDQHGSATGQVGSLPTYSWKGAYQRGSVISYMPAFDISLIATTYAAAPEGNLTGNGFSLLHRTFGIFFCGPGSAGGDGPCTDPATTDTTFAYLPNISGSNYTQAVDFHQDQPTWPQIIKRQALTQYKSAFLHLPAIVAGQYGLTEINNRLAPAKFDHTFYVSGIWPGGSPNGMTPVSPGPFSYVYYLPIMGNAQGAMGCFNTPLTYCSPMSPTYSRPPLLGPAAQQFQMLIPAIGYGIGAIAAHETGHQVLKPVLMDCVGSCESPDVYEGAYSNGASQAWSYTNNALMAVNGAAVPAHIHWGQAAAAAWKKYLLGQK